MGTIIITKENFGQKMSFIYKKLNISGKIKIQFESENDDWDNFTLKNKKAYLQSKKDLEKGETLSLEDLKAKYI